MYEASIMRVVWLHIDCFMIGLRNEGEDMCQCQTTTRTRTKLRVGVLG